MSHQLFLRATEFPELLPLLAALPPFVGTPAGDWRVAPLKAITNRNFRVTGTTGDYVLRIPRISTHVYLDRNCEIENTLIAGDLGLAPKVAYADPVNGLLVTAFETDARPVDSLHHPSVAAEAAKLLHKLQRSPQPFKCERHPFGCIEQYLAVHRDARSADLRKRLQPVEAALQRSVGRLVPNHIDASPANFLERSDGSLLMVDWEFSAMADPLWDIASIWLGHETGNPAEVEFVAHVLGTWDDRWNARLGLFKIAMSLVAGSWAAMEAAVGSDPQLASMADDYLDLCEKLYDHPKRALWLSLV